MELVTSHLGSVSLASRVTESSVYLFTQKLHFIPVSKIFLSNSSILTSYVNEEVSHVDRANCLFPCHLKG